MSIIHRLKRMVAMTLDDLMKTNPPGTKFTDGNVWGPYAYFECWFKANGEWHGKKQTGCKMSFSGDAGGWSLWQEPKKKVKRWLVARKTIDGEWIVPINRYGNPAFMEEAIMNADDIKLESTMIEVDE